MNDSSQHILKKVLLEYMESEAAQVPPTEVLMREHTFSERFLGKMKLLLAQEGRPVRNRDSERKNEQDNESGKRVFFRRKSPNCLSLWVAAACIGCVIVFGVGWMIYRGSGGLTSSDSSATDMAAVDSEEVADSEETVTEDTTDADSTAAGNTEDADLQDGTNSGTLDGGDTQDDSDAAQGELLLSAQAETDLTDFNVIVNSCTAHSMEMELTNETGAEITFGSYYVIEVYNEDAGTWAAADQIYDGVFEDPVYIIRDGETITLTVDWSNLYGELGEGTWRLTKEIQSMEDETFYSLTVTFEI